ncbi:adenosylcobinamide kinase /adenosylcobinamide-phosphate guanylyltransferase [Edaphobacillus lindanitolerans]|uniref:Adenosylcobinamide kinase /adenosylcobinamide-phosphate guanylyltransferase n=1 Tax=Edaphobacillus lindanitolerans TaxID=550447 RepID=A0A1U7PJT8_9BACI|nr:adenosylcobinamide kinase /adenosylcobinamide-phosphate guanylyltransferase [Edaphobacillus lindanitolerans]
MHIFFGGAHNGKREYVKRLLGEKEAEWIEAGGLEKLPHPRRGTVVLAGMESYLSKNHSVEEEAVSDVMRFVDAADRDSLVLIITDIGRGIVPVDAHERWLRDTCGRLNQRLFKKAGRITRIWYGLAEEIR